MFNNTDTNNQIIYEGKILLFMFFIVTFIINILLCFPKKYCVKKTDDYDVIL